VVRDGLPYRPASWHLWRDHGVCPFATLQNWTEAGEKRNKGTMDGAFLDWGLATFSGYVAADDSMRALLCALGRRQSAVQTDSLAVLDHDPNHDDITVFLGRLKTALDDRDLESRDHDRWLGAVSRTIRTVLVMCAISCCTFHVIKDLTQGS